MFVFDLGIFIIFNNVRFFFALEMYLLAVASQKWFILNSLKSIVCSYFACNIFVCSVKTLTLAITNTTHVRECQPKTKIDNCVAKNA